METKYGREVNPVDLFLNLDFRYADTDMEAVKKFTFGIDRYANGVYFPLVIARELGIPVKEVEVPYQHDEKQTRLEEGDPKFLEKRIDQAKDIVDQHFDLIASILQYKERGEWPSALWEAMDQKKPLEIRHFEMREWKIEDGKLERKEIKNPA